MKKICVLGFYLCCIIESKLYSMPPRKDNVRLIEQERILDDALRDFYNIEQRFEIEKILKNMYVLKITEKLSELAACRNLEPASLDQQCPICLESMDTLIAKGVKFIQMSFCCKKLICIEEFAKAKFQKKVSTYHDLRNQGYSYEVATQRADNTNKCPSCNSDIREIMNKYKWTAIFCITMLDVLVPKIDKNAS